jgi:hypothetical protein
MPNSREFSVPVFQAVLTLLGLTERLIMFQSPDDQEKLKTFIQKWVEADNFRETAPRQFLQLFGEGLALFWSLPDYIRNATDNQSSLFETPITKALSVEKTVDQNSRIRVKFTGKGTVFLS